MQYNTVRTRIKLYTKGIIYTNVPLIFHASYEYPLRLTYHFSNCSQNKEQKQKRFSRTLVYSRLLQKGGC